MKTPDITRAQTIAIVQAILAVLVAFGVNLSEQQQTALLGLSAAVAVVLPLADAIIRNGRAKIVAASAAEVVSAETRPVSAKRK